MKTLKYYICNSLWSFCYMIDRLAITALVLYRTTDFINDVFKIYEFGSEFVGYIVTSILVVVGWKVSKIVMDKICKLLIKIERVIVNMFN